MYTKITINGPACMMYGKLKNSLTIHSTQSFLVVVDILIFSSFLASSNYVDVCGTGTTSCPSSWINDGICDTSCYYYYSSDNYCFCDWDDCNVCQTTGSGCGDLYTIFGYFADLYLPIEILTMDELCSQWSLFSSLLDGINYENCTQVFYDYANYSSPGVYGKSFADAVWTFNEFIVALIDYGSL